MRHILGSLSALLLVLTGALLATTAGPASAHVDKDCGDFATQAEAQSYFISIGGPSSDPDRLDADGDGIACDSNPCPCSTSTSTGASSTPATTSHTSAKKKTQRDHATIVQVVDGDTYDVRLAGGRKIRVRVLGIDTPEVYGHVDCGGPQASARAKRMLPRGTKVLLTSDPSQQLKDRYGRSLRYVEKNGTDIGRRLIRAGLAKVYVYHQKPFKRTRTYKAMQAQAQRAHRGIWGSC
ncbi:thermonuclease family protein [Nocardioides sp. CER19]|uniref:thermonuclease family protein n=1 Tax=Nocardioides sp. CER19 TaxID=3038538 RepID=UPI00244A6F50|nr:thermonuclease family protein [Nocardioides sp. CER19]MDH2414328.1 thermonuclease family protein [Nocardioides sp. CER19]